jgi:N-acetylglucosaminyl-diphospho-decaprenol L-rhamnosyltransferase
MISATPIPIIIVGYRNPEDVTECLEALRGSAADPVFDVYVCENGASSAFDVLVSSLTAVLGPCHCDPSSKFDAGKSPQFARVHCLRLRGREARVFVAEAKENLGYAGAINAWLRILLTLPAWPGVWILNPDTQPDARALAELVAWAATRRKGMVGSRLVPSGRPECVHSRGLRWRPLRASTEALDYHASAAIEPDPDELEARIDAPGGASVYVTHACLECLGLMDERYFLYFEDVDWGYRAKSCGGIGYAYKSIVPHRGSTTIGAAVGRAASSPLSVYLEFRNRIHFVRQHHRWWVPWTFLVLFIRSFEYGMVGAFTNMRAALSGLMAALAGETGRPDHVLRSHRR